MLTPHFSLSEMTRTSTGLKNVPNEAQVKNLAYLCQWLEMLRDEWNSRYGEGDDPIVISSAYRSLEVNRAVGGTRTSNHLTGCAADIRCAGIEQAIRYTTILLDIADESQEAFDELIIEHRGVTWWVHFAVRPQNNRRKVLILQQ